MAETAKKREFRRVNAGLYVTKEFGGVATGGITIHHFPWGPAGCDQDEEREAREKPWEVKWATLMQGVKTRRFRTLKEARDFASEE